MEFTYLVFISIAGESYRRLPGSLLLCLCDVIRTLIISLVWCLMQKNYSSFAHCFEEEEEEEEEAIYAVCTVLLSRLVHNMSLPFFSPLIFPNPVWVLIFLSEQ